MSEIKKNIQKNIAVYRKKANLTQKELADRLGVAPTNLASWEQGKSCPDIDTLFALCAALNVNIMNIYGFERTSNHNLGDGVESAIADAVRQVNSLADQSVRVGAELSNALPLDEQLLIDDYRTFSDEGKEKVRDYIADLRDSGKYKKCVSPIMDKDA